MIEKIELKRGKLRGYDKSEDQLNPGGCSSYPFTPKNSYVDSSIDNFFGEHARQQQAQQFQQGTGGILHAIDSELLLRKLLEKRRGDSSSNTNSNNSNASSKSQSLTKLNMVDNELSPGGDMMNAQLSPSGHQVSFCSRPTEIPPPHHEADHK
jgi:hypothetical protein